MLGCGTGVFSCTESSQCGEGICEETGRCSFDDDSCESGRRYGDHAGPLSGSCVTPETTNSSGGATDSGLSFGPTTVTSGGLETSGTGGAGSGTVGTTPDADATGDPDPVCGDGRLDRGEACDDGNAEEADGCSSDCVASGTVVWSHVRPSDAATLEQYSGLGVLGEDVVVAGLGFSEAGTQDVLVHRLGPEGDSVWAVVHDVADDADRGAGLVVVADRVMVFGSATVSQSGPVPAVERWVGLFSAKDGSVLREATLGEGEVFGAAVSADGVTLAGTDGTGSADERAWAGRISDTLVVDSAVVDEGAEASQYYGIAVLPGGDVFAAGMRGSDTNGVADFIVDVVTPLGVSEVQRIAAEFNLGQAQAIASAPGGDLFVGGLQREEPGGRALYLQRYSEDDGVVWLATESSSELESDEVEAVAVAPNGDVLVTGLYWGGPRRDTDVLLRRFDANGELRWSAELDFSGGRDLGRGIAVTPSGVVYVCGRVTMEDGSIRAHVARVVP